MTEDDIQRRITEGEQEVTEAREKANGAARAAIEADANRRFITRVVLWGWVVSLAAFAIFSLVRPEAAAGVAEIIKTAVLPLVTLILGYYLSQSR